MHSEAPLSVTDLESLSKCAQLHQLLHNYLFERPTTTIKQAKRMLLKKKGDVNYQIPMNSSLWSEEKSKGGTLLHIACNGYCNDIVEDLLKLGADFTIQDKNGSTALHQAFKKFRYHDKFSMYGDDLSIDILLTAQTNLVNYSNPSDKNGFSHFHIACAANHTKAVKYFLENDVDVNQAINQEAKHNPGFTPLHIAVKCCSTETVELLLKHNADKNTRNVDGMTPLVQLINQRIQLLGSLRFNYKYSRKILESRLKEIEKMIPTLLSTLSKVDVVDSMGLSTFHIACTMQDASMVKSLLEQVQEIDHCIKVDSTLWPGYTAMHFAAHCNINILKLLHSRGGNIDVKNAKGLTPFDICIDVGYLEDIHEVILLKPELSSILFSDNKTSLANFLSALQNTDQLKNFLNCVDDINMKLPIISPIWPGCTLLHLAVILSRNYEENYRSGSHLNGSILDQIEELLKNGADVTIKDVKCSTPLHYAFRESKTAVSRLLREYHVSSANPVDKDNLSHLHIACVEEDGSLFEKILSVDNVDVNIIYKGEKDISGIKPGWTPLNCINTDISLIIDKQMLLQCGAKDFSSDFRYGSNTLHSACDRSDEEEVRRLLELGANVNSAINDGQTPLHIALYKNSQKIVRLLLERGANLFAKDDKSCTPLSLVFSVRKWTNEKRPIQDWAADYVFSMLKQRDELLRKMVKETGITMLHIACYMLDIEEVKSQLDGEMNVDAQVKKESILWPGCTPLHVLIKKVNEGLFEEEISNVTVITNLLLKKGADVTLANVKKRTPVHLSYGKEWLRKLLIENQRDYTVNPVDNNGWTHLHNAVLANDVDTVEKFLQHGVDPNQPVGYFNDSFGGSTPLHSAIENLEKSNDMRIINLLLKYGADVNLEHEFGGSALREAIHAGKFWLDLVDKLVKFGANVHTEGVTGDTPFERLLNSNRASADSIKFFLERGCRANFNNPANDLGYLGIILAEDDKACRDSMFEEMMKAPDVGTVNEFGRNLIHNVVAVDDPKISIKEYVSLFKRFKQFGFDVDDQDHEGQTALHLAAKFFNEKAISALLDAGADLHITDSNGKLPFFYATESCVRCDEELHDHEYHGEAIAVFAEQILKLQSAGLYVSKSNRDYLAKSIKLITHTDVKLSKNFNRQLDKAKLLTIGSLSLTLGDFLSETKAVIRYSRMSESNRNVIDKVFEIIDNKFSAILSLLKLQHRKAVKRFHLVKATFPLKRLIQYPLPDLCIENILSFLNIADLNKVMATVDLAD